MRAALNENPVVQRVVFGLGVVVLAVLVLVTLGGGDSKSSDSKSSDSNSSASPTAADVAAADNTSTVPATTPGAESSTPDAASGVPETTPPATPPATPSPAPAGAFFPGKGLPMNVVVAYAKDRAIVLLVVKKKGIDDRLVERAVKRLRSRDEVAVFVTPATRIARYSQITQGVNVSRTPALVVILPRSRTNSVPTAAVSYGFRSAASVEQAVEDALYGGPTVPYHPE